MPAAMASMASGRCSASSVIFLIASLPRCVALSVAECAPLRIRSMIPASASLTKSLISPEAPAKLTLGCAAEAVQALLQIAHQLLDCGDLVGGGRSFTTDCHDC